jgi:tRNA (guanine10-N2)-methyltransferase
LKKPFWIVDLPNDEYAIQIASRAVSLKCILELWTHSNTYGKFHQSLKTCLEINKEQQQHLFAKDKTFRVTVETYNKHYTQKEKVDKIETIGYLPSKGSVDLKNPNVNFWYIEFFGMDPNNVPADPMDILFGKWIVDGQRRMLHDISLKTRKFIGNTSMDPQLSILMANQGLVQKGDFVFDPFVGSGSLLVPAAKFGGEYWGSHLERKVTS